MRVHTDDEVYRVDAVWLGPPRATFPWRARYVDYGLGLLILVVLIALQRRLGFGIDFFGFAWTLIATVLLVRHLGRKTSPERPLGHIAGALLTEIRTPRRLLRGTGGDVTTRRVRVRPALPGPRRKFWRRP